MADERQLRFSVGAHTTSIDGKGMRPSRRNARVTSSIRGHERLDDEWEAVYEFGAHEGALVIREISIQPVTNDPPPTAPRVAVLRERLRPGDVLAHAREALLDEVAPEILKGIHALAPEKVENPKGRGRRPPYQYAVVAAHAELANLGGSTQPNVHAARTLGPGWDKRNVRDFLTAAKRKELWIPGAHGTRTSGRLSDAGMAVLHEGPPDGYVGPIASDEMVAALEAAR